MGKEIIVVGAGLVGALWATMLAKKGHKVSVYERRRDMRDHFVDGGRSINLALSTRGLEALDIAGLKEEILELCIPMKGRMMHDEKGSLTFQPYNKDGIAINSVSRAGLNMRLIELAEEHGVKFHFEHKCIRIDVKNGDLYVQNLFSGDVFVLKNTLVFGADGAFSRVRYSMQKTDRFNYAQDYLEHGYKELEIPPGEDGKWLIEKNALHIWPRESFMMIALPNLDGSFTCTLFAPFEGKKSFEKLKNKAQVQDFFEKEFPDAISLIPNLLDDFFTNPTSSLVTVKCYPWAIQNMVLMGDAAHALVPFYGQGMNSGFEDCTVLNGLLDKHGDDWDTILEEYQVERKPNGDAIADLAKKNFIEMRDLVADPIFLLRKKIAQQVSTDHPDKFTPVYSMVSFSNVSYSDAKKEGERQDKVFEEILSWKGIEDKWKTEYYGDIVSLLTQ